MPALDWNNLGSLVPNFQQYKTTNPYGLENYTPENFGYVDIGGKQFRVLPFADSGGNGYQLIDPANEKAGGNVYNADGTFRNHTVYNPGNDVGNFGMFLASALTMGGADMLGAAGLGADAGTAAGVGDAAGLSGMDIAADTAGSLGSWAPASVGSAGWGADLGTEIGGIGGGAPAIGATGAVGAGGAAGTAGIAGGGAGGAGGVAGAAATPGGFSMAGTLKALAPQLIAGGASLIGGAMNAGAAKDAAGIQAGAAQSGIDETRRQFDTMTGLLQPYVDAGKRGLAGYEGLAGTMGAPAQQQAITDLQGTPMWGSTVKAGEDAILQNVAATGGLRGGNVQDALAKFRAGQLTNLVDQQLSRYGSLASLGQSSAARVGAGGMSAADSIAKLLQQQGSANAGGVLAGNNAIVNTLGGLGGLYAASGSSLPSMSAGGLQAGLSQTGVGSSGFGSGLAYGNQDLGGYF